MKTAYASLAMALISGVSISQNFLKRYRELMEIPTAICVPIQVVMRVLRDMPPRIYDRFSCDVQEVTVKAP